MIKKLLGLIAFAVLSLSVTAQTPVYGPPGSTGPPGPPGPTFNGGTITNPLNGTSATLSGNVAVGTTIPGSNPSRLNTAQPAEGTLVPILGDILATAGAAPFQVQQQSYANTGAGSGTYNHGLFYGYNVGIHSGGPVTSGQPGWIMGMEDNFYDTAGSDYGPELYVEHFHPNGTYNLRPFYMRVLNGDSNTGNAAIVEHDIGTDSGLGEFGIESGPGNFLFYIQTNGAQFNVPLDAPTFTGNLIGNAATATTLSAAPIAWSPTLNGFTNVGTPGVFASNIKLAPTVYCLTIEIVPATSIATVGGSSYISNTPYTPTNPVNLAGTDVTGNATAGNVIWYINGNIYFPTITTTTHTMLWSGCSVN